MIMAEEIIPPSFPPVFFFPFCFIIARDFRESSASGGRTCPRRFFCFIFFSITTRPNIMFLASPGGTRSNQQLSTNVAVDPLAISAYSCLLAEQSLLEKSASRFPLPGRSMASTLTLLTYSRSLHQKKHRDLGCSTSMSYTQESSIRLILPMLPMDPVG